MSEWMDERAPWDNLALKASILCTTIPVTLHGPRNTAMEVCPFDVMPDGFC